MSLRKISFILCLLISVLGLATGYGADGRWIGAGLAVLIAPVWWAARKYPGSWLPFFCLIGSIGLAVFGTLIGLPPLLMIFSAALALALWDIIQLDSALRAQQPTEHTRRYEKEHLRSLVLALGGSLFVILLGRYLRLQIPFLVLLLSIAFLLFAIDRVWSFIKSSGKA